MRRVRRLNLDGAEGRTKDNGRRTKDRLLHEVENALADVVVEYSARVCPNANEPAIHVAAIQKTYGGAVAVDDVSFDVYPGEIFGLIGPNSAGKTTTMECVEGLSTPDRGAISVLGLNRKERVHAAGADRRSASRGAAPKRIKVGEAVAL